VRVARGGGLGEWASVVVRAEDAVHVVSTGDRRREPIARETAACGEERSRWTAGQGVGGQSTVDGGRSR
jgi:hypothetical protein